MASILNRYESILSMNVCGMIAAAEDSLKMARHLCHNMEDDLSKTKREGVALLAEIEKLEQDTAAPNAEALLLVKKAEVAKLQEIHAQLEEQIRLITKMRASIYKASRK